MELKNITILKEEKRGIRILLLILTLCWGSLYTPWWGIRFVGSIAIGLCIFTLWRIIEGLLEEEK